MIFLNGATLAGAAPRVIVNAVDFDGATYAHRNGDLSANADSSQGIFFAHLRIGGTNGTLMQIYYALGTKVAIQRNTLNKLVFQFADAAASAGFDFGTVNSYTASSSWLTVLASWDTNFSAGNKLSHLYVNDVSDKVVGGDASPAFNIDYTVADHYIGKQATTGGTEYTGGISHLYFAPGQYLDFSNPANRRKFFTADNRPEDFGADGSRPTGVAPKVFLDQSAPFFGTNSGTGGTFTVVGTPTGSTTSPAG